METEIIKVNYNYVFFDSQLQISIARLHVWRWPRDM